MLEEGMQSKQSAEVHKRGTAAPLPLAEIPAMLEEASRRFILPYHRRLNKNEIYQKSVRGDLVTRADLETEAHLTKALVKLLPNSEAVGEEACHKDPALLQRVGKADRLWVIDPIDGTRNFARGEKNFCLMLALVSRKEILASWIYFPLTEVLFLAEHGGGAFRISGNEKRPLNLASYEQENEIDLARGFFSFRFFPREKRGFLKEKSRLLNEPGSLGSAGSEYGEILEGRASYTIFHRLMPWDHLPGLLLIKEAGGKVAHLNRKPYLPGNMTGGVMAAQNPTLWQALHKTLAFSSVME